MDESGRLATPGSPVPKSRGSSRGGGGKESKMLISAEQAWEVAQLVDDNGDGLVTLEELVLAVKRSRALTEPRIRDGKMLLGRLMEILELKGTSPQVGPERIPILFTK